MNNIDLTTGKIINPIDLSNKDNNRDNTVSIDEIVNTVNLRASNEPCILTDKLYGNLALPSYVHGYSLAIQYMTSWFESKFPQDYFKGGIYVNGKHVLDDYKKFSKNVVKGLNPRARIEPTLEADYDMDGIDRYYAPPYIYLRKSKYQDAFFKDYDRKLFLGISMRAIRMNFNFKIRLNTRSQQLDLFNMMELYFRIGATQYEYINVDFHVPKAIMLNIAIQSGFQVKNGEVVNIVDFLNYLNSHSDIPFLFKLRAINQKPEYFIRANNLYTHINTIDKLQIDDGERNGKLDTYFHIEMNAILTMPIPHFYSFYSGKELTIPLELRELSDSVAIYSMNMIDIPDVDENNWGLGLTTEYQCDDDDKYIDLSELLCGDNDLAKAIDHQLTKNISPVQFMNIKIWTNKMGPCLVDFSIDWKNRIIELEDSQKGNTLIIAIYYDKLFINDLNISLNNYNNSRVDVQDNIN